MNAMTEAREFAIANRTPVIVHANCVRIGSHSNSDKHTLYRDENELAYVKEADPLMKFRRMLLRYKRLTEEDLQQIEAAAKRNLPQPIVRPWLLPIRNRKVFMILYFPNLISLKSIETGFRDLLKERRVLW